ncbi:SOSS complex subunit C-like [Dysidea avara]|uniref:SOSS complex subunit C-like n=1 Tax=Dysidea avara TaxID=196820 RepID=UPI00331B8DCF
MSSKDAKTRKSILQGLQEERSRLQRLQGEPNTSGYKLTVPSSSRSATSSPVLFTSATPQQLASQHMSTARHSPDVQCRLEQQQRIALQHARTHSYGYFIGLPSLHGNTLLPVIPRFDSSGNLT